MGGRGFGYATHITYTNDVNPLTESLYLILLSPSALSACNPNVEILVVILDKKSPNHKIPTIRQQFNCNNNKREKNNNKCLIKVCKHRKHRSRIPCLKKCTLQTDRHKGTDERLGHRMGLPPPPYPSIPAALELGMVQGRRQGLRICPGLGGDLHPLKRTSAAPGPQ